MSSKLKICKNKTEIVSKNLDIEIELNISEMCFGRNILLPFLFFLIYNGPNMLL